MTREDLVAIIYNDKSIKSCPEYTCDTSEEEANFEVVCMTCAERQLNEYENKIRADERAKVIEKVKEIVTTICKRYEPYTITDDLRLNARAWGRIDTCHEIIEQLMTDK